MTAALSVMSGDAQEGVVGQELPAALVVRAVDADGRPVAGQLVNFRVTAGGGSVFAGSAITNAAGIAQERWTLGPTAVDTQRVEARAVDPETGAAIVFALFRAVGRSAPAATLALVSGNGQTGPVGSPLTDSLVVEARDAFGNRVSGATVSWAVTAGGGTVGLGTTATDSLGRARARWTLGMRIDTTHAATATLTGLAPVAFSAVPTLPASAIVEAAEGDAQRDTVGQQLPVPLGARVRLTSGPSVIGATVAWSLERPTGSIVAASAKTDAQGIARAFWTLGTTAGTQYARALTNGTASVARFSAVAVAGPLASLTIVRGNGQLDAAGAVLADSLVVRAADQYGNVLEGQQVQWAVTSGGGSIAPSATVTDAAGLAAARWTLGAAVGEQTATATAAGLATVTFTATASAGTGAFTFVRVAEAGIRLNDVWASGSSDVYAVGDSGLVLHFDGTTWREVLGVSRFNVVSVSGSSPSHVVVADNACASLRFDGTTWTRVPVRSGHFTCFNALSIVTSTFGMGVTSNGGGMSIFQYDGSEWFLRQAPVHGSEAHPVYCPFYRNTFAIAPDAHWIMDGCNSASEFWNGSVWVRGADAFAIWGQGGADYFSATRSGIYRHLSNTFQLSSPAVARDIHGSSNANVFAASAQLHRFDGTQWSVAHDFGPDSATAVWVLSDREVYAVTTNGEIWRGRR